MDQDVDWEDADEDENGSNADYEVAAFDTSIFKFFRKGIRIQEVKYFIEDQLSVEEIKWAGFEYLDLDYLSIGRHEQVKKDAKHDEL